VKALKIVGIVLGILLVLTGGGLLAGSALANKGQAAFNEELAKSGYAGPTQGTVRSVDPTEPVTVTVSYTDSRGKKQIGRGGFAGGELPQVGDTVSTYYSTAEPSQVVVVNLPGLGNLGAIASTLRTAGVIGLIGGGVLLLAAILGLALGKKPAADEPGPVYGTGQQRSPAGYPAQPYPPQPPPGLQYPSQQSPSQPSPPQQHPPQRQT
jgi:Protein of unknown function (DUF3592)